MCNDRNVTPGRIEDSPTLARTVKTLTQHLSVLSQLRHLPWKLRSLGCEDFAFFANNHGRSLGKVDLATNGPIEIPKGTAFVVLRGI